MNLSTANNPGQSQPTHFQVTTKNCYVRRVVGTEIIGVPAYSDGEPIKIDEATNITAHPVSAGNRVATRWNVFGGIEPKK